MILPRARFFALCALCLALASLDVSAQVARQPTPPIDANALERTVTTLASVEFEGRRTGTAGNAKARAWIEQRFRELALLQPFGDSFLMPFRFTRDAGAPERDDRPRQDRSAATSSVADGVNVVGLCRGTGAADNGVMVISAHYDHLGVRDGAVYPGADDNASGVAVILELARQCRSSSWAHDVVFVAFDAEEQGLQGARAFVASPPIPKERIALNVNLDMVSRSAKREIYLAGTYHRPALKTVLEPIAKRSSVTVLFGHDKPAAGGGHDDWTLQSDHGAFHAAGIPFVYFGVEDHPDYHKPSDTADKIDFVFLGRVAATIRDAVTALDRALPLPR
jgi:hypothetical protein